MKQKIYLSGPMTGYPDYNRAAFFAAEQALSTLLDAEFINPARLDSQAKPEWQWEDYMRAALRGMLDACTIYMLNGWEDSRGAKIELELANELGMTVMYQPATAATTSATENSAEIGDHLPEHGGYLIGFTDGCGVIMTKADGVDLTYHEISEFVRGFNVGEHSDWRVPTKYELNLAWVNRDRLAGLEMENNVYWSATEYSTHYAWSQDFTNGYHHLLDKTISYRVRPVRTVKIEGRLK